MDGITTAVALVTGAATGLGAGVARYFVELGASVVIADVQDAAGQALANELGPRALFVRTDLSQDAPLDALLDRARAEFGGLDFLINVACSYAEDGLGSSREQWRALFDVNVFGHALLIQKAVPLLRASQRASIVNVTSASAHIAQMGRWAYPASKAAIEQLTRSAALELAQDGIRVNSLLPGMVSKGDQYPSEQAATRNAEMAARSNMLGRLQEPREVAQAIAFLCSSDARFMTGSCLVVDGGYTSLGPMGKEVHIPRRPPAT